MRMDGRIEVTFAFDPDLTDPIARMLVGFRDWYDPIHALAFSLLSPGDRVLDLGAHVGTFALPVAALGCTVLAVEAAPENVALLKRASERNGLDQLSVVHAAVAAAEGTVSFSSDGPLGQAGRDRPGASSVSVRAVAVDDLLVERSFGRVDLVKIDVEGSEPQALVGMRGLLDRPDGPPILIESNGHTLAQYGATTHDLRAALGRHGYVCYLIDGSLEYRLVPVSAAEVQPECVADYLALKTVPTDLAPWFVSPAFGRAELVERVLTMCRHASVDHRRYAAQVLREAPVWMLAHESIRAAVLDLREDPDATVREAAADQLGKASAPP
jgi:FkbM family methyltransferase